MLLASYGRPPKAAYINKKGLRLFLYFKINIDKSVISNLIKLHWLSKWRLFSSPSPLSVSFQFWDVCSMDHLLARLAIDSLSVSKRIVDLLFKSFFPVNEPEKEWCCRCITLIQMNPMAARKFYQFAHKHTAATNISEEQKFVFMRSHDGL